MSAAGLIQQHSDTMATLTTRFVAAYKLSTSEKKAEVESMFQRLKKGEAADAEMRELIKEIIGTADETVEEMAALSVKVAAAKAGGMKSTEIVDSIIAGTFGDH